MGREGEPSPPCASLVTVQEVCECFLVLLLRLEGPKTYGAGKGLPRGRSAALSGTITLLLEVLNVGVGLSHRSGVIDSVILDHRAPLPRVWT